MKSSFIKYIASIMVVLHVSQVQARIHEMNKGFVIPCEGELCRQMLFCWRGARYADLHQLTKRVTATATFDQAQDSCIDYESDDVLSARSMIFGYGNETAADRLDKRLENENSGGIFRSLYNTIFNRKNTANECEGNICTASFSPYGLSCMRLCSTPRKDGHPLKAEVHFDSDIAIDQQSVYMWLAGIALAVAAPWLSRKTEMFYLTGGLLGVTFAVAMLVLVISSIVNRSSPTKTQLQIAGMFQVGALYLRNMIWGFVEKYSDWIALYIVATFLTSLGLVHYFLKGEDGRVSVSSSLQDIVRVALQLLAAFIIALPIPSARLRLVTLGTVFLTEVLSQLNDGGFFRMFVGTPVRPSRSERKSYSGRRGRTPEPGYREERESEEEEFFEESEARTPSRAQVPSQAKNFSGSRFLTREEYEDVGKSYTEKEIKKLLTPKSNASQKEKDMLEWLAQNHSRVYVRTDEDDNAEDEDEDEEDEEDEDVDTEMDE